MSDIEVLSTDDLRNRMFETLRRRGLVDTLKTQLRNHLIVELRDVGLSRAARVQNGSEDTGLSKSRLCQKAVDSLIADYLKHSDYNYSLSVFLPEAGVTDESLLPVVDVLQLLRISPQSVLYKKLIKNAETKGLLWQIVSEISKLHGRPTIDTGCQTEVARYPTISTLEEQLAKVDAHYTNMESTQLLRTGAVEERILSFQRQLEERYRSELNLAIARFKENELTRLQISERELRRKEIDKALKEMERTYRAKYDALTERERHAVEQLQHQQEIAEKELFSQRQKMLNDIEALQQREVQMRRQQEIDNREKSLWEEKVKTREELTKRREENARRAELEHEQRVRDEVNKFKLEEQARYVERLTTVEFRETRVKENERRVDEQLQDVSNVKVELNDKRKRVNELEAELIRTRHELLSVQKQAELLGERTREMVDYQMLKEDNAVMKRELENTKMRLAELMRDNMVERQKQEELLREMGVQAGKPSPEVALLRQQIDQLHSRHRTEIAILDQDKLQLQQRLEDEIARNKELAMKCEQQTWQQKQFGLEAADLRERLFDSQFATLSHRRPSDFDGSISMFDGSEANLENNNPVHRSGDERLRRSPLFASDDFSQSSDLVQDTKNRIRRLENDAVALEKKCRDILFRDPSVDAILGPSVRPRDDSSPVVPNQNSSTFVERQARSVLWQEDRNVAPLHVRTAETFGHVSEPRDRAVGQPLANHFSVTADRTARAQSTENLTSAAFGNTDAIVRSPPLLASRTSDSPLSVHTNYRNSAINSNPEKAAERITTPKISPTSQKSDILQPVTNLRGSPLTAHSAEPRHTTSASVTTADSHSVLEDNEPLGISLDDAWKSSIELKPTSASEDARQRKKEAEQEEYERRWKEREEEKKRQEEARQREQQSLEELNRKENSSRPSSVTSSQRTDSAESPRADEAKKSNVSPAEPKIDPSLEKYMTMIKQQKEKEKQAKVVEEKDATPSVSEEEISVAEDNSSSSRSAAKDDFW